MNKGIEDTSDEEIIQTVMNNWDDVRGKAQIFFLTALSIGTTKNVEYFARCNKQYASLI